MKYFSSALLFFTSLATLAVAAPTQTLERRADLCGPSSVVTTGAYTVINNLWGVASASPGGSQCFGVDSLVGSTIAWHTSWTWAGAPTSVKSYDNVGLNFQARPLSQVASMPSTWSYTMNTGPDFKADVSYDIFTDSNPANTGGGDHHDFEIMIWLAAVGGAAPIASGYGADGTPNYAATGIPLAGATWNLASGPSGATPGGQVFSFVAASTVSEFNGDLLDFLKHLQSSQLLPFTQNLVYVAGGTESFTGTGVTLNTTAFSVAVN